MTVFQEPANEVMADETPPPVTSTCSAMIRSRTRPVLATAEWTWNSRFPPDGRCRRYSLTSTSRGRYVRNSKR
jgi:hypothetical protein